MWTFVHKFQEVFLLRNVVYEKHKFENIINITKLVTVHYFEFDKNFSFKGESHNFWEMVYIDKGEAIITSDNTEFSLKQGELYFHRPGEFHKIRANGKTAPNVCVATFVCTSPTMKMFERKKIPLPENSKSLFRNFLDEAQNAFEFPFFDSNNGQLRPRTNSPLGSQQLVRIYLETLLIFLLRDEDAMGHAPLLFQTKESMENHIMVQIIDYLESKIYSDICISDVCKAVRYGKTYVSTLFKETTGFSIMQYYTMLKISESKRMIRENLGNISEIAYRLGFNDPRYFSRSFKRITGMTPTEYINSVKK